MREILGEVDLEYLLERDGALTEEIIWEDELSLAEKQRLAIARLIYNKPRYGRLNYRTAARTLFLRPYLAHFCPVFSRFFAVFSVLTPGFQKVAPKDRGPVP